jgi:transketolase
VRAAYRDYLVALLQADDRVVCLDTDTGLFLGADFGAAAGRYVNLGIAEHTLMGVAAGMAASGWRPYVNTMAGFATTRALEAVQVDIAYNAVPVHIVATHSGVSAGHLGPTHHALGDLAILRAIPNITVLVPADASSTVDLLRATAGAPGPVYVRLGRHPTPPLPVPADPPVPGRLQRLREGREVVIVACGPWPTLAALDAAELLAADGDDAGVVLAHTLKPFDAAGLRRAAATARLVVTVEEHWGTGGLGAAVAEILSEAELRAQAQPRRVVRIGLPDRFVDVVGDQEQLIAHYGITGPGIAATIRRALAAPGPPPALAALAPAGRPAPGPAILGGALSRELRAGSAPDRQVSASCADHGRADHGRADHGRADRERADRERAGH